MARGRGRKRALLSGRAPVMNTGGPSRSTAPMTSLSTSRNPSIETPYSPSEVPISAPSSSHTPSSRVGASLLSVPIGSGDDHVSPEEVHVSPTPTMHGIDDETQEDDEDIGDVAAESRAEIPSSDGRTRGPAPGVQSHDCPADRPYLEARGFSFLLPHASRDITSIIKGSYTGAWKTWREVPIEQRNLWFEKFKGLYHWAPENNEIVRRAFNYVASDRLKEILTRARDSASKKSGGSKDPSVYAKFGPPLWMPAIIWYDLCSPTHWGSERWQRLSGQNKKNRRTLKDGMMVTHTGGSINFEIHRKKMNREKGQEPTSLEFYIHTHTSKKTNGFICEKAKRVWDDYHRIEAEKHGDIMLWVNAASSDGPSRNRNFGFGSAYTASETLLRSSRNTTNTDEAQSQKSKTDEDLARYKEQVENLTQQLASECEKRVSMETQLGMVLRTLSSNGMKLVQNPSQPTSSRSRESED